MSCCCSHVLLAPLWANVWKDLKTVAKCHVVLQCEKKQAIFPDIVDISATLMWTSRIFPYLSAIQLRLQHILEKVSVRKLSRSNRCLEWFLNRYNTACRAVTSVGQQVPPNAHLLYDAFPIFTTLLLAHWSGVPGKHSLVCPTTRQGIQPQRRWDAVAGNEKLQSMVVLGTAADGAKLKHTIISKGLNNMPKFEFPNENVLTVAMKRSMTTELMNTWRNMTRSISQVQDHCCNVQLTDLSPAHHEDLLQEALQSFLVSHSCSFHATPTTRRQYGMGHLQQPWKKSG